MASARPRLTAGGFCGVRRGRSRRVGGCEARGDQPPIGGAMSSVYLTVDKPCPPLSALGGFGV